MTRIGVSPYTFSFEFAQATPYKDDTQKPTAKIIFRIVMSPGHAKAFYDIFGQNLKIYETNFGEIKNV